MLCVQHYCTPSSTSLTFRSWRTDDLKLTISLASKGTRVQQQKWILNQIHTWRICTKRPRLKMATVMATVMAMNSQSLGSVEVSKVQCFLSFQDMQPMLPWRRGPKMGPIIHSTGSHYRNSTLTSYRHGETYRYTHRGELVFLTRSNFGTDYL